MASRNNLAINFDQQTLFRVIQGGSFTVPETVAAPSPIGLSSGISPNTLFDGRRGVAGGWIYGVFTNQASTGGYDFQYPVQPNDVIAVSAIASNAATVSVNGVVVYRIADVAITTAGILGFFG